MHPYKFKKVKATKSNIESSIQKTQKSKRIRQGVNITKPLTKHLEGFNDYSENF